MSTNNNYTTFEKIVDKDNIYKAYKQTQKGSNKYSNKAMQFSMNETYNLEKLRNELIDETYEFGKYNKFKVFEPKERVIHAPDYKDKIVQIAINNVIKEIYYPSFIYDSYSCIDNKGTHNCVDRIQKFMRKAKWEYGKDAYIIKIDIKKFFYSIDRKILKTILKKKIKCNKTLNLLYKIIDSADEISELGLPLGNTFSQIGANIYMNEADQYVKRKLSIKYYIRYADDIVAIVENKEKAKEVLELITNFINTNLKLDVNTKKTKIFPINQGVNSIGFKIHPTHKLLRNDSKKRIKRKTKKMKNLILEGKMTIEKAEQILNSWLGHAMNGNSHNFINKLTNKYKYIHLNNKRIF